MPDVISEVTTEVFQMRLSAIGFWVSQEAPHFPHPRDFVGAYESGEEAQCLVTYLESGHPFAEYMGFSYCRLGCPASLMLGSSDLTDGVWVWPQGLSHYIKAHSIVLPGEYIRHAKGNAWTIPEIPNGLSNEYDFSFWAGLGNKA